MIKLRRLKKDEDGSTILVAVLVLFLMFGMGGLAVDAGYLYKTRGEMKKAANAASLSGAQLLYTDNDSAIFKANALKTTNEMITANNEEDCTKDIEIMPDGSAKVTVQLKKSVSTFFMKIFGVSTIPLTVTSSAKRDVEVVKMGGLRPLGINSDSLPLDKKTQYTLKDDDKIGDKGWFGFIDLSGAGDDGNSNDLKDFMVNGAPYLKSEGDYVGIGHGNKQDIINELNNKGITELTVPIIVYKTVASPEKNKEMQIEEFILVKITYNKSKKEIYGEFIKTVNLGSDTGSPDEFRVFNTRLVN